MPQIPHDAVATKCRSATFGIVERLRQSDKDRVVGLAELAGVAGRGPEHLVLAVEQSFAQQEADRELRLVAGGPHGHRDGDRILPRSRSADLERRFPDHPVVADLERVAADGDDPPAGHMPDRRLWLPAIAQAGH